MLPKFAFLDINVILEITPDLLDISNILQEPVSPGEKKTDKSRKVDWILGK